MSQLFNKLQETLKRTTIRRNSSKKPDIVVSKRPSNALKQSKRSERLSESSSDRSAQLADFDGAVKPEIGSRMTDVFDNSRASLTLSKKKSSEISLSRKSEVPMTKKTSRENEFEKSLLRTKKSHGKRTKTGIYLEEEMENLRRSSVKTANLKGKGSQEQSLAGLAFDVDPKLLALDEQSLIELLKLYFDEVVTTDKRYEGISNLSISPEKRAERMLKKFDDNKTKEENIRELDLKVFAKYRVSLNDFFKENEEYLNKILKKKQKKLAKKHYMSMTSIRLSQVSELFFSDHDSILDGEAKRTKVKNETFKIENSVEIDEEELHFVPLKDIDQSKKEEGDNNLLNSVDDFFL